MYVMGVHSEQHSNIKMLTVRERTIYAWKRVQILLGTLKKINSLFKPLTSNAVNFRKIVTVFLTVLNLEKLPTVNF